MGACNLRLLSVLLPIIYIVQGYAVCNLKKENGGGSLSKINVEN